MSIVNYIYYIKKEYSSRTSSDTPKIYTNFKIEKNPASCESIYWSNNSFIRLLLNTYFQANYVYSKNISIICEGKTDVLHLKNYLSAKGVDKELYSISYFSEDNLTIFQKELNIQSGTSNLSRFIDIYSTLYVTSLKNINPTIILVDADKAGEDVFKKACGRYNKTSFRKKANIGGLELDFAFICKNLYLLKIPKNTASTDACIEDLYDNLLRSIIIDGKSFSQENDYDNKLHYGKVEFFNSIIKPRKNSINYNSFDILFEAIQRADTFNKYKNIFS